MDRVSSCRAALASAGRQCGWPVPSCRHSQVNAAGVPLLATPAPTVVLSANGAVGLVAGDRSAARARAGSATGDLSPRGGHREPASAEGVDSLATRVAGILIARKEVQRVAVVGDLRL